MLNVRALFVMFNQIHVFTGTTILFEPF